MNQQLQPVPVPQPGQPVPPVQQQTQGLTQQQLQAMEINEAQRVLGRHSRESTAGISLFPSNLTFATQNSNEKVFLFVRRHWSENIAWISRNIGYAILPFFAVFLLNVFNVELSFMSPRTWFAIILVFYSIIFTNVVRDFFDWYFDTYIITNQRIISYDFKPFAKYVATEASLENISKIKEKAGGPLSDLFNYGSLTVLIEGPSVEISFSKIPNPTKVRDILSDLVQVAKKYHRGTFR